MLPHTVSEGRVEGKGTREGGGGEGDEGDAGKRRECHRRRQLVLCVYAIALLLSVSDRAAVYLRLHVRRNAHVYVTAGRRWKMGVKYILRFGSITSINCDYS